MSSGSADTVRSAVIVDAVRSPIGRAHKGGLVDVRPDDLLGEVLAALFGRHPQVAAGVDEVVVGCGYPWGEQGFNVARAAALLAGLPAETPAYTVSRLCASSLQAIRSAAHAVMTGEADVVVAGGVESVSRVGRDRHLAEPNPRLDPALPGPTVADYYRTMVETAETVAEHHSVSRERMDEYAQRSQERAVAAQRAGVLDAEITPIRTPSGGTVHADEGPRPTSTQESLAGLRPILDGGRVTAGNACPLNDGAAAVLVTSEARAAELGLEPRARIRDSVAVGVAPEVMGVGPIEAVRGLLARNRLRPADIDVIELNEAFAAQVIPVLEAVGVDPLDERVNPHGGAIALGHPFGMTGVRIMCSLLNALEARDGTLGIETMCVGGGQGQAMLVERFS